MQVKDIMSASVKTVSPTTPIAEVVSLMCLYRYSGLPVVDNDKLVGMLSLGDVHKAVFHANISESLSAA